MYGTCLLDVLYSRLLAASGLLGVRLSLGVYSTSTYVRCNVECQTARPEGGPTFAKYPKCFLTLEFLGSGLAVPILGYLAFLFCHPTFLVP
jgi:hypothetical protein